jgi:hypothetical protein
MGKHKLTLCSLFFFFFVFISPFSIESFGGKKVEPVKDINLIRGVSSCLNRINIPPEEMHWVYVPFSSSELHTEIPYLFLAGQLIASGAVSAPQCPAGGLGADGYANACGLSVAMPVVIQMQNIYDDAIMKAWTDVGVLPVMLKQLFRYESQFWPGPYGTIHFGLGHLTYMGAQTALLWNQSLFNEVCALAPGGCGQYVNDSAVFTLLNLVNATCPTCANKIDIPKAQQSVHYNAEAILGYCFQTAQIIYNATGTLSSVAVDYPTIWKLTLMSYNVGASCVSDAVFTAYDRLDKVPLTWKEITSYVDDDYCLRGVGYANTITEKFYSFPP